MIRARNSLSAQWRYRLTRKSKYFIKGRWW